MAQIHVLSGLPPLILELSFCLSGTPTSFLLIAFLFMSLSSRVPCYSLCVRLPVALCHSFSSVSDSQSLPPPLLSPYSAYLHICLPLLDAFSRSTCALLSLVPVSLLALRFRRSSSRRALSVTASAMVAGKAVTRSKLDNPNKRKTKTDNQLSLSIYLFSLLC